MFQDRLGKLIQSIGSKLPSTGSGFLQGVSNALNQIPSSLNRVAQSLGQLPGILGQIPTALGRFLSGGQSGPTGPQPPTPADLARDRLRQAQNRLDQAQGGRGVAQMNVGLAKMVESKQRREYQQTISDPQSSPEQVEQAEINLLRAQLQRRRAVVGRRAAGHRIDDANVGVGRAQSELDRQEQLERERLAEEARQRRPGRRAANAIGDFFHGLSGSRTPRTTRMGGTGRGRTRTADTSTAQRIGKNIRDSFQHFTAGANQVASNRQFSGVGEGVQGVGALWGGDPITKWGGELLKTVDSLKEFGQKLHDTNVQFAEYSAAMTQVQVRRQVSDIDFSRARGDARARSAGDLEASHDRMRRGLAPYEDWVANTTNTVMARIADGIDTTRETVESVVGPILEWLGVELKKGEEDKPGEVDAGEWVFRLGEEMRDAQIQGRPPRFGDR